MSASAAESWSDIATQEDGNFDINDCVIGISAFLAGNANVIMQLSQPPVGYGVVESKVHSGSALLHPFKRLRTTLTYLAVALIGTDDDRRVYREAVNRQHRQVRSSADSPVSYNAFDPRLQLWVAACLFVGFEDILTKMYGPLDRATADALYRECERLGTTLQVRADMWPADRQAFQRYWHETFATASIDDTVRDYLMKIVDLRLLPWPLRLSFARMHRFVTTGFLPPELRDQMRLSWSTGQQRRFDAMLRVIGAVSARSPRAVRQFPFNFYLWDMRRRVARGRALV
ncbi:DUF2236 domain-containing protein [Skermania sp. ID1734]|uniref:oxygenase MpaB family protein n=1 Tax=Skermania sp. ID1734 TaxID=2597516 RepID=UPI00117FA7EE|nr:oxygenase MpaB family protein [Skermania sp. ID1734]TSE02056.1 DUF2236 domain-containing protein [Skermania sp. ID1734]